LEDTIRFAPLFLKRQHVVFILPVAYVIAVLGLYRFAEPSTYSRLFGHGGEDSLAEWAQFVAYCSASIIGWVTAARIWRRRDLKGHLVLIVLFSLGCGLIAMEEVSWGQWIFGWESGEFFQTANRQHETNIHNANAISVLALHWAFISVGAFGGLGRIVVRRIVPLSVRDFILPNLAFSLYFLVPAAFYLRADLLRERTVMFQEAFELLLSVGFLLLAAANASKAKTLIELTGPPDKSNHPPTIAPLSPTTPEV
jgi:hypothetical protein